MEHRLAILAPAGDRDMLRAAVFSGADSVYLGFRGFNARRGAANFDAEELAEAVAFCHARGCTVNVAVNTLVLPGREKALEKALCSIANAGADALIVQDLAVATLAQSVAPTLALHASTQMSVHSPAGVEMLAKLGFSRAILARELARDEIAAIAQKSPIELEVFVHGALCVSVSGQCYASAFLGGRSANRGACAGPCRLPFMQITAEAQTPAPGAVAERHDLSLKDLSILDALPELEQMGIAAAKIEGRLRGPEYCAVVVDAARKALDNQEYDKELLQSVFSRSGFTDGWYTGKNGATMFGARTEADAATTKRALPKARALYRRERPRVPVQMRLAFTADGGQLAVTDGTHTVKKQFAGPLPAAERDPAEALAAALGKTGGTPFYLESPPVIKAGGAFLAAPQATALRRAALEELLALRQAPPAAVCRPCAGSVGLIGSSPAAKNRQAEAREYRRQNGGRPPLCARFESLAQVPDAALQHCMNITLPLAEAENVPESWRERVYLALPRVAFGPAEQAVARQVEAAKGQGFAGFAANNLAHFALCQGQPVAAGFGMNIANAVALARLATIGCVAATLTPELSLAQLRQLVAFEGIAGLADAVAIDCLCYGHLPLFLTRACPQKTQSSCGGCAKKATLVDRKGARFAQRCTGGVRSIYNPVPLWMADRLEELPGDTATLYFTTESRDEAARVLHAFAKGERAQGPFTRGLYDRGTEEEAR